MRTRSDCYVMIDVEASGSRLGYHDMTQFGAIAACGADLETKIPFPVYQPDKNKAINLIAPHFGGDPDPDSLAVAGISWDDIKTYGEKPIEWAERFHAWVVELRGRTEVDRVVLVGHGITFDWARVKMLYDAFRNDWPCHYSGLDFKSWWGGLRSKEYIDSSMTDMREAFGIEENKKAHDAQADAEYQLELMLCAFAKADLIRR